MSIAFEKILAFHASPALVGIKSANLISISLEEIPDLMGEIKRFNEELGSKISLYVVRMDEKRALILIYKPGKLAKVLFEENAYAYLLSHGYPKKKDIHLYLEALKEKMSGDLFPHEIGVFLGYDLYDTMAFERHDKECIYVGYWQVYKDKEKKTLIFERYTRCRNILSSLVQKGYRLENLIA